MKLLKRQKKEVQETEELIENLTLEMLNNDRVAVNSTTLADAPSIASSILAGFDYGYVSRSEGCRVENLEYFNKE